MSKFEGVADTLFIPLTARVFVSKRFPEYFYDAKALELESALPDNSIEQKSSEYALVASAARYYNMDEMVKKFIAAHPQCNIAYLGCGLETAYDRIGNRTVMFYQMDQPEVIKARREVLGEAENEKLIAGDLFDMKWADEIADRSLPTLMVVSGVFEYFHEEEILAFIAKAKELFAEAELIFDATNSTGIKYTNKYVQKTGNTSAMMYFYVDDCEAFAEKSGTQLIEWRNFYTDARKIIKKASLYTRICMAGCDILGRAKILHLKL